jgi:hypothetical protein
MNFHLAGADMNRMADETLALTVAEVTMQDWLAAVTHFRQQPQPILTDRYTALQPAFVPWTAPTRSRGARRPVRTEVKHEATTGIGGARSLYWWALAAALLAMLAI